MPNQPLTREQIDAAKEAIKQKNRAADELAEEMAKTARATKNPDVKKAVEDALKAAGRPDPNQRPLNKEDVANIKQLIKAAEQSGDDLSRKLLEKNLEGLKPSPDQPPSEETGEILKELRSLGEKSQDEGLRKSLAETIKRICPESQRRDARPTKDLGDLKEMVRQPGCSRKRHCRNWRRPPSPTTLPSANPPGRHSRNWRKTVGNPRTTRANGRRSIPRRYGEAATCNSKELLKNITPEMLKQEGITDEQWRQFKKNARDYEEWRRKQAAQASPKDGAQTQKETLERSPALDRRRSDPSGNSATAPLQNGRGQPPPGFPRCYHRFTETPPAPQAPR